MTTSLPAAKVRADPSYRTVSAGGAGRLIATNSIGIPVVHDEVREVAGYPGEPVTTQWVLMDALDRRAVGMHSLQCVHTDRTE